MYLGLAKREFPNREIRGVIIAAEIDDACDMREKTTLTFSLSFIE